jgi:hypothetical protein
MPDVATELRALRFEIDCLARGLLNQDSTLRRIEEKIDQIIDLATSPEDSPLVDTLNAILVALDKLGEGQVYIIARLAN